MSQPDLKRRRLPATWICGAILTMSAALHAADLNVTGNLTVSGTVDSDGNTVSFGTQSTGAPTVPGALFTYSDNSVPASGTDSFKSLVNRSAASWLWLNGPSGGSFVNAMRLDSAHQLILFNAAGTAAGLTLTPASNQISFGSATLSNVGGTLTTNSAFTANGNMSFTGSDGSLALSASGVTLSALGTGARNVTLNSSGTGDLIFNTAGVERVRIKATGNVGIGTSAPGEKLEVFGGQVLVSGTLNPYVMLKSSASGSPYGFLQYDQSDGNFMRIYDGSEYSMAWKAGNVGIGTTTPSTKLHVLGGSNYTGTIIADGPSAGYSSIGLYENGSYKASMYWHPGAGAVSFNGSARWFFETGNLGIGTPNPTEKLEVNGNVKLGSNGQYYRTDVYSRLWTPGQSIGSVVYNGQYGPTLTYNANYSSGWKLISGGVASSLGIAEGRLVYSNGNPGTAGDQIIWSDRLVVEQNGNVGIGTTNPGIFKLAVKGKIHAEEIVVETGWADYVFDDSYQLAPLSEVESHIKTKKHLPGIPSAAEVAEHGVSMGDMQSKLLSKVEELTLHLIAQEKEIAVLRQQMADLKATSIQP